MDKKTFHLVNIFNENDILTLLIPASSVLDI